MAATDASGPGCRLFDQILAPGMTFVDVGANIGYSSLLAARIVAQTGAVARTV